MKINRNDAQNVEHHPAPRQHLTIPAPRFLAHQKQLKLSQRVPQLARLSQQSPVSLIRGAGAQEQIGRPHPSVEGAQLAIGLTSQQSVQVWHWGHYRHDGVDQTDREEAEERAGQNGSTGLRVHVPA